MITDFETFMIDVGQDRIFRLLFRRRPGDWTPMEMERQYIDQSQYESTQYTIARFVEAIELPNKDILMGYKEVFLDEEETEEEYEKRPIHYRLLSEMEISFFPQDMYPEEEEDYE